MICYFSLEFFILSSFISNFINKAKNLKKTLEEYKKIISYCKEIFYKKNYDYGNSWKILRLVSFNDQIIIKIKRIRYIQEKEKNKIVIINDLYSDFIGIINYSIFAIISLDFEYNSFFKSNINLNIFYDNVIFDSLDLLEIKNKNYQDYWINMDLKSILDIILMRLLRIKKIKYNNEITLVSDGIRSNYQDIINYSILSLIKVGFCK